MNVKADTFYKVPAAAGTETIVVTGIASPLIAIAAWIAPGLPPAGSPMLALKLTLNKALHWFVIPLNVVIPLPDEFLTINKQSGKRK